MQFANVLDTNKWEQGEKSRDPDPRGAPYASAAVAAAALTYDP